MPEKLTFQEDIGETFSLIYSPFYIKKQSLVDGVTNQVLPMEKAIPRIYSDLIRSGPVSRPISLPAFAPAAGQILRAVESHWSWYAGTAIPYGGPGEKN